MNFIHEKEIPYLWFQKVKKRSWSGLFSGKGTVHDWIYIRECQWIIKDLECQVIFTRDTGHNSCGWWKNPDYERCYHLSITFFGDKNQKTVDRLIDGLFGEDKKLIWIEPPYSDEGKRKDVWHYRLFCDENWQPIKPRGEVYSKQFTERGWKSFSEVQSEKRNSI